jgi:hypothetical protein
MENKMYYVGYIRDIEIYMPCSISEEYEDCYNMLILFVKSLTKDISNNVYIKQISVEVFNKIVKCISPYNFEFTKINIIKNNKNKDYIENLKYKEFLKKKEDGYFCIVTITEKDDSTVVKKKDKK